LLALACLLTAANGAVADLNDGLVGYWSFDEGEGGTAYDYSGHGNHGSIHGATWSAGISGGALSFDGDNDYVALPSVPSLHPSEYTYAAWVHLVAYTPAINTGANVFANYRSYRGSIFYISPAGAVSIRAHGGGQGANGDVKGNTIVSLNVWVYVSASYDGTRLRVYANGNRDGEQAYTGYPPGVPPVPVTIGKASWYNGSYIHGRVDELRIYNRALSEDEILDLYWSVNPNPQEDTTEGDQSDVSGTSNDPVNTATGSFFHQETDLSIPSRGSPLIFTRFYNSKAAAAAAKSGQTAAAGQDRATSQPASTKDGERSVADTKKPDKSAPGKEQQQTAGSSHVRSKAKEDSK
ncbi:MAG: LamG domain-containing protein, partial [Phycisphaerae bacterium]|nr:LamG domain-containing protein [Phycisphaerae bacterium]